jgi:hypothetical protein
MRSPNRKRVLPNKLSCRPDFQSLGVIALRANYVGSVEHKDCYNRLTDGCMPRPRADASICPRWIRDIKVVNRWLKSAIERGAVCDYYEGDFPRYVWFKYEDTVFMGRLVNKESGAYKGFPLNPNEWPKGIEKIFK